MELLAKFNKTILAPEPSSEEKITYDLNLVITTAGMTGKLQYSMKKINGLEIEKDILYVYKEAGGYTITIEITDENKNSARASTKIISFSSITEQFSRNESLLVNFGKTKESWASIIGDKRKEDPKKK
jgi:hypothetical protein